METGAPSARHPISPELVLVDPELAAEARAALPWRPWPPVPRFEAERAAPARRRRPFAGFGFLAGALAAVLVLAALSVFPNPDRPTFAAAPQDEIRPGPPRQPPAVAPPSQSPRIRPAPQRPKLRQPVPQKPQTRQPRPSPRPAAARVPRARSLAWPQYLGALYYQVRILRDGKVVFRARPRAPRTRVRLAPGRYRWIVRPAIAGKFSTRLGDPIVDSTVRVDGD